MPEDTGQFVYIKLNCSYLTESFWKLKRCRVLYKDEKIVESGSFQTISWEVEIARDDLAKFYTSILVIVCRPSFNTIFLCHPADTREIT